MQSVSNSRIGSAWRMVPVFIVVAGAVASMAAGPESGRTERNEGAEGSLAIPILALPEVGSDGRAVAGAPSREPDIYFVPTPQSAVDKMLELAEIKKGDVLYDLGCGDGRIVVTAAKRYGIRAVGIDIDPRRVLDSLENVRTNNVESLVTIRNADIFTLDLSEADVVTLYLLPELNVKLMPQLRKLKPGSRIVSYEFDMQGAKPVEVYKEAFDETYEQSLYKWVVPWEEDHGVPVHSGMME